MSIPDKLRQLEAELRACFGPVGRYRCTETGLVHLADVCFVVSAGRHGNEKKIRYVTADGTSYEARGYLKELDEALGEYPSFARTASNYVVNLDRVTSIRRDPERRGYLLGFGDLEETALVSTNRKEWVEAVQDHLDLPTLEHVVPYSDLSRALRELDIRPYPNHPADDLRFFPKEFYLANFSDGADGFNISKFVRTALWQLYLWIREGKEQPVQGLIRSFWYTHLKPVLDLLGLTNPNPTADQSKAVSDALQELIIERGLFHYWDMGFLDDLEVYRRVGTRNPHVVFFTEKAGLFSTVNLAYKKWGVTVIALGGAPRKITTTYFVRDLGESDFDLRNQPLYLFGFTDYDPAGTYAVAEAFRNQLEVAGAKVAHLCHLAQPRDFDPRVLAHSLYEIKRETSRDKSLFARWKRDGYDILREGNKVYGISANLMQPAKALEVFEREAAAYLDRPATSKPSFLTGIDLSRWPGPPAGT